MKFETFKSESNKKKLLLSVIVFIVIGMALIISVSLAKYRTTQSIPLVSGSISYSPSDIKIDTKLLIGDYEYLTLDTIPTTSSITMIESVCTNDAILTIDSSTKNYKVSNLTKKGTKCEAIFGSVISEEFDYSGKIEEYVIPKDGNYKLEVWGAQGGNSEQDQSGGYGGYSVGEVTLAEGTTLFIGVGGQGQTITTPNTSINGGFNGGGSAYSADDSGVNSYGSGGGATHIATAGGLLSSLESNKDSILIVAGGGAGSAYYYNSTQYYHYGSGGHGGGYQGVASYNAYSSTQTNDVAQGGTQSASTESYTNIVNGTFGQGANGTTGGYAGGGGGYYGGATAFVKAAGGGSGYIGNSKLTNQYMVCYNCKTSTVESTYTISNTNVSDDSIADFSKKGNGYAKITLLETSVYKPVISVDVVKDSNNIGITVNYDSNNLFDISKYYYTINDQEYISSENNTYTFSDLEDGTYIVKVYVEDNKGITSDVLTHTLNIISGITIESILAEKTISTRSNFSTVLTSDTTGTIYSAEDDDGTSYYFAGAPTDNWVKFAGFYWRIIRINGDGTIRLIYNGTSTNTTGEGTQTTTSTFNSTNGDNSYVGYKYSSGSVHGLGTSSTIKGVLDSWYDSNLVNYASYIDINAGFCNDRQPSTSSSSLNNSGGTGTTVTYYASYIRMYTNKAPTLKCKENADLFTLLSSNKGNNSLDKPIGLITADEVAYAGGVLSVDNSTYYLYTGQNYYTMSPSSLNRGFAAMLIVNMYGWITGGDSDMSRGVRPVINLKSDTIFLEDGTGKSNNPYVVQGAE